MKRLRILTLIACILALIIHKHDPAVQSTTAFSDKAVVPDAWMKKNEEVLCEKDIRPADQTFLTYPEWFLVHSPAEQAAYFKTHTASGFPYTGHISQIWKSYKIMCKEIRGRYEYNSGYHFMIWVIGVSTTVEYALKGAYETTVGRLTDTYAVMTDEDKFNAKYMQEYVDFIRVHPWYDFDFKRQLKALWSTTSYTGDHLLRKWERKYWLTSELIAKWGYGWLIRLGTETAYDEAGSTTVVVTGKKDRQDPHVTVYTANILPRYEAFRPAICKLAASGEEIVEIAGNRSAILITVIAPSDWNAYPAESKAIFTQKILTRAWQQRVALVCPVGKLNSVLNDLRRRDVEIEHVYDY
jgi:hypothetical protein